MNTSEVLERPVVTHQGLVLVERDRAWAESNIGILANMNTAAFSGEIWGEKWDMDPDGQDVEHNSYAMIRYLLGDPCCIYTAMCGDQVCGYSFGLHLSNGSALGHGLEECGAEDGDFYAALVVIAEGYRHRGLFPQFAEMRLRHPYAQGRRQWVQTHPDSHAVVGYYIAHDFSIVCKRTRYFRQSPSPRVVLMRDLT